MQDNEYKPFGELSRDEQIKLFSAWLDGKKIEWLRTETGQWYPQVKPGWNSYGKYRIAPTKPSIDWSHVAPEFKYLATDSDGLSHLFDSRPTAFEVEWSSNRDDFNMISARYFASFTPGTCDWRDSLVERPEQV